jgi:phytol kinase
MAQKFLGNMSRTISFYKRFFSNMNLIFAIIFFIVLLSFIEILKRFFNLPGELSRKLAHIASAFVVFFLPYFLGKWQIVLLISSFVLLLSISKWFNILKSLHSIKRKTWGEIFLPIGVGASAILFLPDNLMAFQFGILAMGFSDGLAGILGKKFGKCSYNLFGAKKTYFGSLVFFVVTFIIFMLFANVGIYMIPKAILASTLLTVTEAIFNYGSDNLAIPVLGAYIIMFLR